MSPLDNELRHTLSEHATDVADTPDLWTRVEHRARVMHRRRLAAGGVVGTAVLAAVVVVGINVTGGPQADKLVPAHTPPPVSTQASPSASSAPASSGRVSVTAWPIVGTDPGWVRWDAVLQSMPAQMPSGFAPLGVPHVVGAGDTDGGPVAVFVVKAGNNLVAAAVLRSAPDQAVAVHDLPADGDVPYVGVVVHVQAPGGAVDDGVVVGAPTTGQIEFRLPGKSTFQPVDSATDPRWATVTLGQVQSGQPVAQVRVVDGDGNPDHGTYTGPIEAGVTFPDV